MPLNPSQDLETSILRALSSGSNDNYKAVHDLLCHQVTKEHTGLLPTLGIALSHQNQDVRLASALAISRFGSVAETYVPQIAEALSKEQLWWVQAAQIQALGAIPCQRSVEVLCSYLSRTEDLRSTFMQTTDAIVSLAPHVSKDMEHALGRLSRFDAEDIRDWATETYVAVRRVRAVTETIDQRTDLSQPHMIIGEIGGTAAQVRAQFSSPESNLPKLPGTVFDDYILYRLTSNDEYLSKCRLKIHRLSNEQCVVGFIADGNCFNASLDTLIENLATATAWRFGLNPQTTMWVREWHPGLDGEPGAKVVDMGWNHSRGIFVDPRWSKKNFRNFDEILGRADT